MQYTITKNQIVKYPLPKVFCTVNLFEDGQGTMNREEAIYWLPFEIAISGKNVEEIDLEVNIEGERLYLEAESSGLIQDLETANNIILD